MVAVRIVLDFGWDCQGMVGVVRNRTPLGNVSFAVDLAVNGHLSDLHAPFQLAEFFCSYRFAITAKISRGSTCRVDKGDNEEGEKFHR
jgi:hypothetical protein